MRMCPLFETSPVSDHLKGTNLPIPPKRKWFLNAPARATPAGMRMLPAFSYSQLRAEGEKAVPVKWRPSFLLATDYKDIPCSLNESSVPIMIIHAPSSPNLQVDIQTLSFSLEISVMIYCKDIAIIVKIEVLAVSKTSSKNLELASVWVATQYAAWMRVTNSITFFS